MGLFGVVNINKFENVNIPTVERTETYVSKVLGTYLETLYI